VFIRFDKTNTTMGYPMARYKDPDPTEISCESCGCLYVLYQTWKEPAVAQYLKCKQCDHEVWRNGGGRRTDSITGREYSICGEYQGAIIKRTPTEHLQDECEHEYKKERIMGAHTGDWICVKSGHIRHSRPD